MNNVSYYSAAGVVHQPGLGVGAGGRLPRPADLRGGVRQPRPRPRLGVAAGGDLAGRATQD